MKVSFVIPVYKVEQYLDRCVKSITCQTYRNIEIILVDDGSPDSCSSLCDKYEAEDNRIKAVHKENGGLSDARNYGTKFATGDYLMWIAMTFGCTTMTLKNWCKLQLTIQM